MIGSLGARIKELHHHLQDAGVEHAFGGAIALLYAVHEPRNTRDIDVNISVPVDDARRVLEALSNVNGADLDESWRSSTRLGLEVLTIDCLEWIGRFTDNVVREVAPQLPYGYGAASLESGLVLSVANHERRLDIFVGELLTNHWRVSPVLQPNRSVATVRDILNQVGGFFAPTLPSDTLQAEPDLEVLIRAGLIDGRFESESFSLRLQVEVEAPPGELTKVQEL